MFKDAPASMIINAKSRSGIWNDVPLIHSWFCSGSEIKVGLGEPDAGFSPTSYLKHGVLVPGVG